MTAFNYFSKANSDGSYDVKLSLDGDPSNGNLNGTFIYKGDPFRVIGYWAAAGSTDDRKYNALCFSGADAASGTVFVAATGTFTMNSDGSWQMQINCLRVSTNNDHQYGWDGELYSAAPDDPGDDF